MAIDSLQSGISQVLGYLEDMQHWFLENKPPAADEMRKMTLFFNRLNPQFLTLKDVIQDAMQTKPPTLYAPTMFYQLMGTFLQAVSVVSLQNISVLTCRKAVWICPTPRRIS